jgi:hypothetical protein
MAITDQVWREDVDDEEDYVRSFTKVLVEWSERLRYQRAPPALIQRVDALRDQAAAMCDELAALKVCFPKEP